jgi:hypothetical protein
VRYAHLIARLINRWQLQSSEGIQACPDWFRRSIRVLTGFGRPTLPIAGLFSRDGSQR